MFSTPGGSEVQWGIHKHTGSVQYTGRYHDKCEGRSLEKQLNLYGNPDVLNITRCEHDIPGVLNESPSVMNIPGVLHKHHTGWYWKLTKKNLLLQTQLTFDSLLQVFNIELRWGAGGGEKKKNSYFTCLGKPMNLYVKNFWHYCLRSQSDWLMAETEPALRSREKRGSSFSFATSKYSNKWQKAFCKGHVFILASVSSIGSEEKCRFLSLKWELQRENKLISYERAFKMLENYMYITGIGRLLSFEVGSEKHGDSPFFRNFRKSSDIWGSFHRKWRHIWQVTISKH